MLTQVYRYGPARQRIWKGFIVQADNPASVLDKAIRALPQSVGEWIRRNERQPACVWVDSGLRMLHTVEHRQNCFKGLRSNIQLLQGAVQKANGRLLPNAIRSETQTSWDHCFCGDIHFLETIDDNEKEVFCNLLRQELPVLIAATSRSGVTATGVDSVGSRRLLQESRLLAARYFASVSPKHLERVVSCLRREQGVSRLESLDVGPLPSIGSSPGGVEIRFTDGQVLLTSVQSHALLYQALLIQARRKARDGRRVGNIPQGLVERNRARAIADGMRASFELDHSRPDGQRRNEQSRGPAAYRSSRELLIMLLESLRDEFQVLECEFIELAPLVLGLGLRMLGLPGLQNESDWLRQVHRSTKAGQLNTLALMESKLPYFPDRHDDLITAMNRDKFPSATQRIQKWWESSLHLSPTQPEGNSAGQRKDRSKSAPRSAKRDDRNTTKRHADQSPASPSTRREKEPPTQTTSDSASPNVAVRQLAQSVQDLGPSPSTRRLAGALLAYLKKTSSNLIAEAMESLEPSTSDRVRVALQTAAGPLITATAAGLSWSDTDVKHALDTAYQAGLSRLRITGPVDREQEVWNAGRKFSQSRPQTIETFLWSFPSVSEGQVAVELLLVSRTTGGNRHE